MSSVKPLSYQSHPSIEPQHILQRLAYIAAVVPMLCGISVFILWLTTGAHVFVTLGMLTILGGFVLFLAGVIFLSIYAAQLRRAERSIGRIWRPAILLALNFPLAIAFTVLAAIMTDYTRITVVNDSDHTISHITIAGEAADSIDGVKPHSRAGKWVKIQGEGEITFNATVGGRSSSGTVHGYVTPGLGGPGTGATITFSNETETVEESF